MSRMLSERDATPAHPVEALEQALDPDVSTISRREVPPHLLVRSSMAQLLRMALEEWVMIAGCCVLVIAAPWCYPVVLLPLAGRYHALGVILHDAAHMGGRRTVGRSMLEVLCGYPIATTLRAMRYHHLRHHRDSGMSTDPYFKVGRQTPFWWSMHTLRGALLFPFWTVRAVVGVVAAVVPALRNVYGRVFLQDRSKDDLRHSPELVVCARAEFGQVAFQGVIAAALLQWPAAMTWCYLVPVTIAYVVSARRLLIEHHYEAVADRRPESIVATTNDHHLGWLGAVVLAPRNVGYHLVHHLHPQVGLAALPKLRAWYETRYPGSFPPAG